MKEFDDVALEGGIRKFVDGFEKWLRNCIENNVDKSGTTGYEFKLKEDTYQVVFEYRKNDDTLWWIKDEV